MPRLHVYKYTATTPSFSAAYMYTIYDTILSISKYSATNHSVNSIRDISLLVDSGIHRRLSLGTLKSNRLHERYTTLVAIALWRMASCISYQVISGIPGSTPYFLWSWPFWIAACAGSGLGQYILKVASPWHFRESYSFRAYSTV